MPRYFFNRVVNDVRDPDPEGLEFPDPQQARYEATIFAADTLKSDIYALWDGGEVRVEVNDGAQRLIFAVVIVTSPPAG